MVAIKLGTSRYGGEIEVEVAIFVTDTGKKFYALTRYANMPFGHGSRAILSDARGKPLMWTRKADMVNYAKKHGYYISGGHNYIGGGASGSKWM